jgi:alkyl sulfatase BDS1-like metallo-beta-lactamase superfamily hydrolase
VIDPLTADETARAAYDLVTEQLGKRPVSAIIYTHSHIDHFGGAGGILPSRVPDADPGAARLHRGGGG